ncbi:hypothetical protein CWR48_18285 [Oceanobacillus arenosus]|uniref:DUF262 domain-containing protein n=1 Tax=Oceanobacillus arenosus TaxID=1229153 RepID=A0A3D8PJ57_9BACI|nr:DUF262 domain-containing protein [Oceanobacillus arenosus]RDW16133.1 hypothetical protein CWR48_18285 [Oceanobacillus arenosus]
MSIDTKRLSIGKLLGSVNEVFRIPLYQRPYNWGRDQWNDLWEDLIRIDGNETHFLGSVITISQQKQKGFTYLELVDGQQRITTILILLIAIRDLARESDEERAAYIDNYFLKSSTIDEFEPKLILGRKDNKLFKKLVEKRFNGDESKNKKIVQAYNFFIQKLQNSKLNWQHIYTKLLDSLDLVLMVTDSYYDAFKLFETLNNRGLSLSSVDLIKNYLLSKFSSNEDEDLLEETIEIWDSIIENIEDIQSVRHDKVRFFRHYLFSTEYGVVTIPRLYSKYQWLIDTSDDLSGLVKDIWLHSEMYLKLYNGMMGIKEIDERLKNLVRIEATASYPLLLKCFSQELSKEQLILVLDAIEVFMVRRSVCDISTRDIDRVYNHLALEAFTKQNPIYYIIGYLKNKTPTDNEFFLHFQSRDFNRSGQTKYILEAIENFLTNNTKEKIIGERSDVHIEHIMPREIGRMNSNNDWQKELGVKATEYTLYVNKIGNLTLLGSELNITASNSSFSKKKGKYEQSAITITKNLCQKQRWTFDEIVKRSKYLAGLAKKIWAFNNTK